MTTPELWWLAGPDGKPLGPFARGELAEAAAMHGLASSVRTWREGANGWRPLAEVLGEPAARAPVWLAFAATGGAVAFCAFATLVAVMLWVPRVTFSVGTLSVLWPLAGWSLLILSLVAPLAWIAAARRLQIAPEQRAIAGVASVIAPVCGLALALFQLHLQEPALEGAMATEFLDYVIDVDTERNRIAVEGSIGVQFGRRFKAALAQLDGPVTVDITSEGGLVDEAMLAASALEGRPGVTVAAHGVCASACLIVLMAAEDRLADSTMRLDIHTTGLLISTNNRLVRWAAENTGGDGDAYLLARGVPADMLASAKRAGYANVLSLSPATALKAGILTAVAHGGQRYGIARADELPRQAPRHIRPAIAVVAPVDPPPDAVQGSS